MLNWKSSPENFVEIVEIEKSSVILAKVGRKTQKEPDQL
jgi:hypothetical protein